METKFWQPASTPAFGMSTHESTLPTYACSQAALAVASIPTIARPAVVVADLVVGRAKGAVWGSEPWSPPHQ